MKRVFFVHTLVGFFDNRSGDSFPPVADQQPPVPLHAARYKAAFAL